MARVSQDNTGTFLFHVFFTNVGQMWVLTCQVDFPAQDVPTILTQGRTHHGRDGVCFVHYVPQKCHGVLTKKGQVALG